MDNSFLYEFSERQEALREAKAYQSTKMSEEVDVWWGATERIRSLPVKARFDILVRHYPGEFRLCSEDTCRTIVHNDDGSTTVTESIVPVEHSHEHECVNHDEENCSWIHPIEIKRSSMMLEDDDSLQANESAGGDYVRDWDDLYLDFPPGKADDWTKFSYAKSRTVTRQTGPSRKRIMKEEFTLKETLPNDPYGSVYGVDRVNYELSTATAKQG